MPIHKKVGILFFVFVFCAFFQSSGFAKTAKKKSSPAPKKTTSTHHERQTFGDSKTWGVGPFIGTDFGVNAKYWLGGSSPWAVQGAFGYDFSSAGIMVFSDALYHFKNLTEVNFFSPADIHGYAGGGLKVAFAETTLFVRIPLGANLLYQDHPYDLFVEIVPSIKVTPTTGFGGDFAIGGRYYF